MLGDEALVQAVLEDYRTSPILEKEKALLAFVEKVNADCASIRDQDVAALRRHGWTDEAIYDAVTVCALFNFYNRWIDATGVQGMPSEAYRTSAKRLAARGYALTGGEE